MKNSNKHISILQDLYGKNVQISQPICKGEHHPIYIVGTEKNKTVFRFSTKDCAFRNFKMSNLLRKHGISVPEVCVFRIDGKYCETYDFIEGKTLYERHMEGLSAEKVKNIYTQLFDICRKMARIPVSNVADLQLHTCKCDMFFKLLNNSPRIIGHCDLNDKNILLDKDDNICAILDLDGICLKTPELLLINLFECASEKGYEYNIESIKEFFPHRYHDDALLNLSKQYKIYKKLVNIKDRLLYNKQMLQTKGK